MCGIAGELRFDGANVAYEDMHPMVATLKRRGPDSNDIYIDKNIGLAHTRLEIIDLSSAGAQPMVDSQLGLVLVFNGTIYNYVDLRKFLTQKGYRFFSDCDSEIIIKAYHFWGENCVAHFEGDFAFAIWNTKKQELFLGRDRMGVKPLYYSYDNRKFRFASNMQALLCDFELDRSIDEVALHHHLTLHAVVPAPRTLIKGVRKLMPAHTMTVDVRGKHQVKRFWDLHISNDETSKHSEDEWLEVLEETLINAIQQRFVASDVPVGVLLSGGLDSSLIVALLAQITSNPIKTYTIGFEHRGQELGNEFKYSDMIAEQFNTFHHKFDISDTHLFARLPEVIEQMSEPMLGQDCIAFYLLCEQVKKSIKTVQTGQGADEVFGGYFWYQLINSEKGSLFERFRNHYFDRDHNEYLQTVNPALQTDDVTSSLVKQMLRGEDKRIDAVLRMDITTLIVDDPVKRVDNMALSWGVEGRVPFLDHHLVELAMRMPEKLKISQGGKYILRKLAKRLLPRAVVEREKAYFPVPALKILDTKFRQMMCDVLSSEACAKRRIFNPAYIDWLINSKKDQLTPIQGNKLWHCAVLEMWMQAHLDK